MDICPAEDEPEATAEGNQPTEAEHETTEQVTPSSTDVEPASERKDLESPINQQPEPPPPSTEQVTFHKLLTYLSSCNMKGVS